MVDKKEFWENKIIGWEDGRYRLDRHNLSFLENNILNRGFIESDSYLQVKHCRNIKLALKSRNG